MRIPYLGLLALGGAQNQENNVIELEKQVIEQLEKELDQNSQNGTPCPDGNFRYVILESFCNPEIDLTLKEEMTVQLNYSL